MSYPGLVQSQKLYTARVTAGARHHTGARWLKGRGSGALGESATARRTPSTSPVENPNLARRLIDPALTPGVVEVGSAADFESSVRLLAARGRLVSGVDHSRSLMLHERSAFVPAASSRSPPRPSPSTSPPEARRPWCVCSALRLPTARASACRWRCRRSTSPTTRALRRWTSPLEGGQRHRGWAPLQDRRTERRGLRLPHPGAALREIRVTSNTAQPIAAGAELAVIRFVSSNQGQALGLALKERVSTRSLLLLDRARGKDPLPLVVRTDLLEEVEQAEFSGDGTQLLLSGVSRSHPTLLRAALVDPSTPTGAFTLKDEAVIETTPARIDGMSWTSIDRFSPCTRSGRRGIPEPACTKTASAAPSTSSRCTITSGTLAPSCRTRSVGTTGSMRPGTTASCGPSARAAPASTPSVRRSWCARPGAASAETCDPTDAGTCAGHGLCAYRPLPIEDEMPDASWLCSSECNTDTQCFQHDCLNGPCRFCTAGACNECNVVTKNYGPLGGADGGRAPDGGLLPDFVVTETVGCPTATLGHARTATASASATGWRAASPSTSATRPRSTACGVAVHRCSGTGASWGRAVSWAWGR